MIQAKEPLDIGEIRHELGGLDGPSRQIHMRASSKTLRQKRDQGSSPAARGASHAAGPPALRSAVVSPQDVDAIKRMLVTVLAASTAFQYADPQTPLAQTVGEQ